ncbi:MAG: ADP-ribosylglycohydrolase family protein [Candidatus Microsaccharimonas sp.]
MNLKCIGAITGDIVGSVYEFDNIKTKDFPLFSLESEYTDDSILTIATMEALIMGGTASDFIASYQQYGKTHPSSYGFRFSDWIVSDEPRPYGSFGNGSAMRVSPVAWFYSTLAEVEEAAKISASVTHNHPEGIKGAQATAAAIFMARSGSSKQEIKKYIQNKYEYLLDFNLSEIRSSYDFDESCAGTVPPAIVAFLESINFEDSIRNAISIGGDSDTLAAITGSIAEAFYDDGNELLSNGLSFLSEELADTVIQFNNHLTMLR